MSVKITKIDEIGKIPIVTKESVKDIRDIEIPNYKAITDTSNNQVICINSKRYKLIQHRDVATAFFKTFEVLDKTTQKIGMELIGNKVLITFATLSETIEMEIEEGTIKKTISLPINIVVTNSYDKTTSLSIHSDVRDQSGILSLRSFDQLKHLKSVKEAQKAFKEDHRFVHRGTKELVLGDILCSKVLGAIEVAKRSKEIWLLLGNITLTEDNLKELKNTLNLPDKYEEMLDQKIGITKGQYNLWNIYTIISNIVDKNMKSPLRKDSILCKVNKYSYNKYKEYNKEYTINTNV
jgi:hypothetical protein